MDCQKVGKLIYQLRKEKGFTQQQLADVMNISNKAISKWERGLGCPDISLIQQLSNILGVSIEGILYGNLNPNNTDGGNMKKISFYICPYCGNIITSTGKMELTCCGKKLASLTANQSDVAHNLNVQIIEDDYYITFAHEMTKEHYINFVAYVSYDRILLVRLYPEQGGEVRIPRSYGGKLYFGCSKHGLWEN